MISEENRLLKQPSLVSNVLGALDFFEMGLNKNKKVHTPTFGGPPLLTGGSGGRPRWSAATAEPLHTLWLQPKLHRY